MNLILEERRKEHVVRFWNESKDEELQRGFPFMKNTLEEAVELFEASKSNKSTSCGKIILFENKYIGDVWCYSIDQEREKSAFLSIVIFDKLYWKKGIGSEAIRLFTEEMKNKYRIERICAFTYKSNVGSSRALEKAGFESIEEFQEEGVTSIYYELNI